MSRPSAMAPALPDFDPQTRDAPEWTPEEFEARIGETLGTSDWIELTQEDVNAFALATRDLNFVHVSPERAAVETPLGGAIVHGFLTLSLLSQIGYQVTPRIAGATLGLNYGLDRARFVAPVPVGARVRGRLVLAEAARDGRGGFRTAYDATLEIEGQEVAKGGRPALTARWLLYAALAEGA